MRATRWLLGMGTAFSVLSAVAAGCGSSTTGSSPAQDSGTDVTTEAAMEAAAEAAPETGPDVAEAAVDAPCVPDANITMFSAPDAAIGDAGATAAGCLACFENACPNTITKCNASCACVSAFEGFTGCISAGGSITSCGLNLIGGMYGNSGLGYSDVLCAAGCAVPQTCGITLPAGDGGGDTGTGDSAAGD